MRDARWASCCTNWSSGSRDAWRRSRRNSATSSKRWRLFETPPLRVLERSPKRTRLGRVAVGAGAPRAIAAGARRRLCRCRRRSATRCLRHIDAEGRREAVATRVRSVAHDLERAGHAADALAAYRAAGADADVRATDRAHARASASRAHDARRAHPPASRGADHGASRRRKREFNAIKLDRHGARAGAVAVLVDRPARRLDARGMAGVAHAPVRRHSVCVGSAARSGDRARPCSRVWVVGGVVPPRAALDGFATQSWVLVLAVLAVGVAVGNSGLLYRVALLALGRKPATLRAPLRDAGAGGNGGDTDASQCHEPRGVGGADGARSRGGVGLQRGWTRRDRIGARIVCRLRTDGRIVPHRFIGGPARAWVTAGLRARRVRLRPAGLSPRFRCTSCCSRLRWRRSSSCIGRKTRRAASATGSRCNARCWARCAAQKNCVSSCCSG